MRSQKSEQCLIFWLKKNWKQVKSESKDSHKRHHLVRERYQNFCKNNQKSRILCHKNNMIQNYFLVMNSQKHKRKFHRDLIIWVWKRNKIILIQSRLKIKYNQKGKENNGTPLSKFWWWINRRVQQTRNLDLDSWTIHQFNQRRNLQTRLILLRLKWSKSK